MTTYLTRDEITAALNKQFNDLRAQYESGTLSIDDCAALVHSENDLADGGQIEEFSSNLEYCRDLQNDFIYQLRADTNNA